MKKCEEIEKDLPLYLDNALPSAEKQVIEDHLQSCPQCTKTLARLSKTRTMVNNLAEVEPPAWLKQKIMTRVHREAEKKSLLRKWFYPLRIKIPVQIFATVCIAVLAVYIYRAGEERMKEVVPSSMPAPVAEVQKSSLPESKIKTSADKALPGEEQSIKIKERPEEMVRQADVKAKDVNKQIASGVKADEYDGAPAVKSFDLSGTDLEKKKESSAAMKAGGTPPMQSSIPKPNFLVRAANVNAAATEVEKLLVKYDAKNIVKQVAPARVTLRAELKNRKMKDFTERLGTVGMVEERVAPGTEENIPVLIEIINN